MYLKKVVPKVYHRKIPTYLFQTLKVDDLPGHLKLSGILCSSAPKPGLRVQGLLDSPLAVTQTFRMEKASPEESQLLLAVFCPSLL